jgi:hypothetical protein
LHGCCFKTKTKTKTNKQATVKKLLNPHLQVCPAEALLYAVSSAARITKAAAAATPTDRQPLRCN